MNYLKEKVYSVIDDRLQLLSLIGFFTIFVVSILNYLQDSSIEWLLRISIYGSGVLLVFFFSHKGTWITWFIVAYVMFYFSHYRNVTYFSIVVILISFYEKLSIPLLSLYAINVFVICHLHNLELMKIVHHVFCCVFIYFSMQEVKKRVISLTNKKLELKADEIIILDYLSKDIQQNDIPDFTPVTVSRKLRSAKIRNGIGSTSELVERYKKEKVQE